MTIDYVDENGQPTSLLQLVRDNPEWAAARIKEGEKAAEQAAAMQKYMEKWAMPMSSESLWDGFLSARSKSA